jgi:serine/threonine-protein kinase
MSTVAKPRDESQVFPQGELIGDTYEIRALLGAGGMGEVYEAHDRQLNRRVAIKVVRNNVAADYLLREGRALAAIRGKTQTRRTVCRHRSR